MRCELFETLLRAAPCKSPWAPWLKRPWDRTRTGAENHGAHRELHGAARKFFMRGHKRDDHVDSWSVSRAHVSKIDKDASLWRSLESTVTRIKERNRDIDADELQSAIDTTVQEALQARTPVQD